MDMTEQELLAKIELLQLEDEDQRNKVVCSLIGHSRIQTTCFGYYYCDRCEAQVGDSLGSVYTPDDVVIVGHNCSTCRENYENLTWKDKLFCRPDPFRSEWDEEEDESAL